MDRPGDERPGAPVLTSPGSPGGRLEIRGQIGAGSAGVVVRAVDRRTGHEVAVKILREPTADALFRLKTEFRAFADLRHPNLVRLYELIDDGGTWMITMELVRGVDFLRWVRPSAIPDGDGVLDETRLRHAAVELARGLEALHVAGYLHRDIKPSNVIVTEGGRVVLLDGGLVAHLVDGQQESDVLPAGTLAYMAPEQGAGRRLTPKSDWYAAGALLYHAMTGRPPFLGTPVEVISAKLLQEPPRPSTFVPALAPDLDQLAVDLLRRRPKQRPAGREVIRRLGGIVEDEMDLADGTGDYPMPFAGREAELATLAPLLAGGWSPRVVLVTGAAGVGKSALVREATRRLELGHPETWVVWSRTHPRAAVPMRGLDGLVDELARRLRRLAPEARAALEPALKRLEVRFPILGLGSNDAARLTEPHDPADEAFALGELLATIGLDRPLVLVIDDAHLARPAAIAFLRAALDGPIRPRVAVVLIGREDGDWSRGLGTVDAWVALAELDEEAALALAAQRVVPEDAAALVASCGGHPGLLVEVARRAVDLRVWYAHRRAGLGPAARGIVEAIARAGVPIPPEVAAHAAGAEVDAGTIDDLAAACLVRVEPDGRLRPYHERIAEVVLDACDEPRMRALDQGLGEALLAAGDGLAAARRWHAAGELDRAREAAARAGSAAAAAGVHAYAIAAFELALACGGAEPEPSASISGRWDAGQIHAGLAEALAAAGRIDEAVRAHLAAAERSGARRALDARRRAAELLVHDGQLDAGARLFAEVLEDLGLPAVPRRGDRDLAELVAQAREAGEAGADPLTGRRLDLLWAAASAWSEVDPTRTARLRRLYLELARAVGDTRRRARATSTQASAAAARRMPDEAARWQEALEHAAKIGLAEDPAFTAGPLAYQALFAGDLATAADRFDRVIAGLRERGGPGGAAMAAAVALALACRAHLGDIAAVRAVIERVRDLASRDRLLAIEIATGGAAIVDLANGHVDEIYVAAERAAGWPIRGFTGIAHQRLWAVWHAHVYRGDIAAARREIEGAWPAARRAGVLQVAIARLDLLRMRALTRALSGDRDGAERDRAAIAAIPLALAAPSAAGVAAAIALGAGDPLAAARAWRDAAAALEPAGLTLHARAAIWQATRTAGDGAAAGALADAARVDGIAEPELLFGALAPAPARQ